jgi:hypothetical protein
VLQGPETRGWEADRGRATRFQIVTLAQSATHVFARCTTRSVLLMLQIKVGVVKVDDNETGTERWPETPTSTGLFIWHRELAAAPLESQDVMICWKMASQIVLSPFQYLCQD